MHEAQERFVHSARDSETYTWVKTVLHICRVLVREQLQQYSRHFRMACFGIRGVVELATCPLWRVDSAHILYNLCLHIVSQVTCINTALACREVLILIIIMIFVDNECTNYLITNTCIGMESEAGMERNTQSWFIRVGGTTTCEVVHPDAAGCVVVHIVVFAVGVVVNAIRNTRILHPVACCFNIAWQTTGDSIGLISK